MKLRNKFRFNANDVEIVERHNNLILAKISPDFGPAFYDISNVQFDNGGDEHFYPSPNANGLNAEIVDGGPREPKSLEHMKSTFDDLVAGEIKREIAAAEARERAEAREKEFVARKQKGQEAKDRSKAISEELKLLAVEAPDVKAFTSSKRVQKLADELNLLELYKVMI